MQKIKKISDDQKAVADKKLKSYGLKVTAGSIDEETNKVFLSIDKGCAATYDQAKVAEKLVDVFEARSIVLDGKEFNF